jgi:hypothetical protein
MDYPLYDEYPRARSPYALWMLAALVGMVLGMAAIASV